MTSPSMSLHVIEDGLAQLHALLRVAVDECDGEAIQFIELQIREYLTQEAAKINSYVGLIRSREDTIDACNKEIDRIKGIRDSAAGDVDRLKGNALAAMQQFGVYELIDQRTKRGFRRQGNGGLQPLEIAGWPKDSSERYEMLPYSDALKIVGTSSEGLPVVLYARPDTERIRAALKQRIPCSECHGCAMVPPCPRCNGEGTIPATIPGAKLLPRGEQVRVK